MRAADPTTVFLSTGLVFRSAMRAYWIAFAIRVAVELGLPPIQLVLLGTAMELTILVSEIPTGVVADVVSRRLSVIISFGLMGLAVLVAGTADRFGILVAGQVLAGFGYTFQSGAETAWYTDEIGSASRAEPVILRRGRLQLVASVAGIGAGAVLALLTTLSTTIVVSGVVLLAWGVLLALVMPENGFERPTRAATPGRRMRADTAALRDTFMTGTRLARRIPALRVLLVVMVVTGFASEAVDRLDVRRLEQLGMSTDTDAIVIVSSIAALQAVIGALALWGSRRQFVGERLVPGIAILLAGSSLGIMALAVIPVVGLAATGLVLQGGLRNAAAPVMVAWTNAHANSRHRATIHSFVGQAEATGEISGGVVLGSVATFSTVPASLTVSAVLFGAGALYALRARSVW